MPVLMVAAGWKLLGQSIFAGFGLIALAMGFEPAGYLLIGTACGSLVPIAEKKKETP